MPLSPHEKQSLEAIASALHNQQAETVSATPEEAVIPEEIEVLANQEQTVSQKTQDLSDESEFISSGASNYNRERDRRTRRLGSRVLKARFSN